MAGTDGLVDALIFKLAVQQVKDYALFVLDPAGRIMTWNVGAQRIKGYAPEEIIGRHFSVFYTPGGRRARLAGTRSCGSPRATGRFEDEGWRVRKDGSRFWANVVITALRDDDGKLDRVRQDHARPHRAPRARKKRCAQSEERFRLLVEGVQDYAIFMLDPDGVVTSWNAGAQRIKGYAARRDHRPALLASSTRPRTSRPASPGRSSPARGATAASRTKAGACARTASASGRGSSSRALHDADGHAARLRQGHAGPHRAAPHRSRCRTRRRTQRVHRHARARAAQSARADPHRGRGDGEGARLRPGAAGHARRRSTARARSSRASSTT